MGELAQLEDGFEREAHAAARRAAGVSEVSLFNSRLSPPESFDTGASLGIPALTAHRALTANQNGPARLSPGSLEGSVVLVTEGAGAVGHAAIQLARWAGATVITTVSGEEKGELARQAGAHCVINYRTANVAQTVYQAAPGGVDTIVDVNAPANIGTDLEVLKPGGTISIYAAAPGESLAIPFARVWPKTLNTSSSSRTPLPISKRRRPLRPSPMH